MVAKFNNSIITFLELGALYGKMLHVKIFENNKIDACFKSRLGRVKG